jgi:hypothetical protein
MKRVVAWCGTLLTAALFLIGRIPVWAGALPVGGNVQITDLGLPDIKDAHAPDLAVRGDTVYAVWKDDRESSDAAIFFAKSTHGGATWSANQRISHLPEDDWNDDPVIAVQPDGAIWVAWYLFYGDDSEPMNDIRLARSTDGGASFQVETFYDGDAAFEDVRHPQLAVDNSNGQLYLLKHEWFENGENDEGFDLTLFRYNATTQQWTPTQVNDARSGRRIDPARDDEGPAMSLTAGDGVVCAAWEDKRSRFAIYGACSTDGGANFGADFIISGPDTIFPRIALGPSRVLYAGYIPTADANHNVVLRSSTDLGLTWSEPVTATNTIGGNRVGEWDLVVDANGQALLAWNEDGGAFSSGNLWLTTTIDRGVNFATRLVEDEQGQYPTAARQAQVSLVVDGSGAATRAWLA